MTIHVVYDTATFYTQTEYAQKFSSSENVQSMVERPEIYMFAAGSSSAEDQAVLLQDRIDCLPKLSSPIATSTGTLFHDKLGLWLETTQPSSLNEVHNREEPTSVGDVAAKTLWWKTLLMYYIVNGDPSKIYSALLLPGR